MLAVLLTATLCLHQAQATSNTEASASRLITQKRLIRTHARQKDQLKRSAGHLQAPAPPPPEPASTQAVTHTEDELAELRRIEDVEYKALVDRTVTALKTSVCIGTGAYDTPPGFMWPETYPAKPAWDISSVWANLENGVYGKRHIGARYAAISLADHQKDGGYYYVTFGDESSPGNQKILTLAECNFGKGHWLKMGHRFAARGHAVEDHMAADHHWWEGTTWRIYENPHPRALKPTPPPPTKFVVVYADGQTSTKEPVAVTLGPRIFQADGTIRLITTTTTTDLGIISGAIPCGKTRALPPVIYHPNPGETILYVYDLYLRGQLTSRSPSFQHNYDGSSTLFAWGLALRMDPGYTPIPNNGDNFADIDLRGQKCMKFFGNVRKTEESVAGSDGVFFTIFSGKVLDSSNATALDTVILDSRAAPGVNFSFDITLNASESFYTLLVHDLGQPKEDKIEVDGRFLCEEVDSTTAYHRDFGSATGSLYLPPSTTGNADAGWTNVHEDWENPEGKSKPCERDVDVNHTDVLNSDV